MARLHSQIPGSQMKRSRASVGGHQSSSCIAAVAAHLRSGNMCSELAASLLHKTLQLSAGDFLMLTFQKLQKCSKRNKNKKKMPTDRPPAAAESKVHPLRNWFRIYSADDSPQMLLRLALMRAEWGKQRSVCSAFLRNASLMLTDCRSFPGVSVSKCYLKITVYLLWLFYHLTLGKPFFNSSILNL